MKKLRRFYFYIKYRLVFDIRYGEGKWGIIYEKIGNRFNPIKPGFWRRNKPPKIDLPKEYKKIVPIAYYTGEGWDLHWGALYDGNDSNVWDEMYPEPLCDITGFENHTDYSIYEWPFLIPYATGERLEKAGFYLV